ncbi:MAG: hypothetical protein EOO01_21225, partial [Chitinophagaceae bacterium]
MKIQFKTAAATFVGLLFVLLSCKKQSISEEIRPAGLSSPPGNISALQVEKKIRTWLKDQQPVTDPVKSEKIRLLEDKLDFSGMRSERLHADKQLLVVPILSGLSTLSENAGMNALFIQQDGSGNIRSGHIVQYSAGNGGTERDAKSIFAMYHPKEQSVDANYSFLTITGHA